jgi:hypothetical protein
VADAVSPAAFAAERLLPEAEVLKRVSAARAAAGR